MNSSTIGVKAPAALAAALACAAYGWPVFPCRPGEKTPATPHGFKDASTDEDTIRRWWARMPDANLAIATGHPAPDVLDVDNHGDAGNGFAAFNRLKREGVLRGAFALVTTPRGGLHIYYRGTEQGNRSKIGGYLLDFRGKGGYVLAPPSVVGGKAYERLEWRATGRTRSLRLADVDRVLAPRHDTRPRASSQPRTGGVDGLLRWLGQQQEGSRNASLYWAARRVVESGGGPDDFAQLAAVAAQIGLGEQEIHRTIRSAQNARNAP